MELEDILGERMIVLQSLLERAKKLSKRLEDYNRELEKLSVRVEKPPDLLRLIQEFKKELEELKKQTTPSILKLSEITENLSKQDYTNREDTDLKERLKKVE